MSKKQFQQILIKLELSQLPNIFLVFTDLIPTPYTFDKFNPIELTQ